MVMDRPAPATAPWTLATTGLDSACMPFTTMWNLEMNERNCSLPGVDIHGCPLPHELDVATRAKVLARPLKDDAADIGVATRAAECVRQSVDHLAAQDVEAVGPIHRDCQNAVGNVLRNRIRHGFLRS